MSDTPHGAFEAVSRDGGGGLGLGRMGAGGMKGLGIRVVIPELELSGSEMEYDPGWGWGRGCVLPIRSARRGWLRLRGPVVEGGRRAW